EFSEALATATGYRYSEFFESGRAALTALLRAWAVPGRDEVVVPAYTCWSVPASIVRAGLKVRLIDVDPHTLDRAETALRDVEWRRVAAVVAGHLLDRTCDVDGICRLVRQSDPDVRIVEDAAQAWPAASVPCADAVLLSFGRGKPLPLGG